MTDKEKCVNCESSDGPLCQRCYDETMRQVAIAVVEGKIVLPETLSCPLKKTNA